MWSSTGWFTLGKPHSSSPLTFGSISFLESSPLLFLSLSLGWHTLSLSSSLFQLRCVLCFVQLSSERSEQEEIQVPRLHRDELHGTPEPWGRGRYWQGNKRRSSLARRSSKQRWRPRSSFQKKKKEYISLEKILFFFYLFIYIFLFFILHNSHVPFFFFSLLF